MKAIINKITITHTSDELTNGRDYIGIQAKATVQYRLNPTSWRLEWLTSSGLWGIDANSDKDYIEEIEQEQLENLKAHLLQFNVSLKGFDSKVVR